MEEHESGYEQMIEVNNTNEGTEYIPQELVQEIIVQNDSNEEATVNCEMTGMEIILSDDVAVQDQSSSNAMITCSTNEIVQDKQIDHSILQKEPKKEEILLQINNVDENNTNNAENNKQEKIEAFVIQTDAAYLHDNLEVNNTINVMTNPESSSKDNVAEIIMDTSESVPIVDINDSGLHLNQASDDYSVVNDSQNVVNNVNEADDKNIKGSQHLLENIISEKETDSFVNNTQKENVESIKVETESIVEKGMDENVAVDKPQSQSGIQSVSTKEKTTVDLEYTASDKVDCKEVPQAPGNEDYSVLLTQTITKSADTEVAMETVVETKVVMNSDDVAVLTEFNSTEYCTEIETMQLEDKTVGKEKNTATHLESNIMQPKEQLQELTDETNEKDLCSQENKDEVKVESVESNVIISQMEQQEPKANETSDITEQTNEEDEDELDLHLSAQSTENHRKVIQDIFDDWQDENGDEENMASIFKENHDSVEIELENLLNDGTQPENSTPVTDVDHLVNNFDNFNNTEQAATSTPSKPKIIKSEKLSSMNKSGTDLKNLSNKSPKSASNNIPVKDQSTSRLTRISITDHSDAKLKLQSPRPGVKIPGMHLTSQIASTAEVNEVLKERLREKQKDLVTPKTADIVFVKKITQRLSSQLSAATATVPPLIPIQSKLADTESDKNNSTDELSEMNKSSSATDSKELLAILEGDVDPDWSNLKPQSTNEDNNRLSGSGESHTVSGSSKLDPQIERELALKQLLELPNIPSKKINSGTVKRTKRVVKSSASNSSSDPLESKPADDTCNLKAEIINLDSSTENTPTKKATKTLKENNSQNAENVEISVEESRSGRKRKLTEKAREHELSVKRQKVLKGRTVTDGRKLSQDASESEKRKSEVTSPVTEILKSDEEPNRPTTPKSNQTKSEIKQSKTETRQSKPDKIDTKISPKQELKKEPADAKESGVKSKMTPVRRPKLGLAKKDAPISKRKLAVKNLMRQKVSGKKVAVAKAKAQISTPKTASPTKTTPDKGSNSTPPNKTKKSVSEIDRLLQDEGVVNLLYDVEQPDSRKRLVPITKSQKKIMDVDKAERELKLRTKLVRNAVLRLRNSNSTTVKISPRSRRNVSTSVSSEQSSTQSEKKLHESSGAKSPRSSIQGPLPSDFIIPAKIRNAADASRIIRRHSSSSFSSASASPRVSIDLTPESVKIEEPDVPAKSKRKLSQDTNEKVEIKKGRKRGASKAESEEKDTSEKSPVKKEPIKKFTRSNVAAAAATAATAAVATTKLTSKNKKVPKSKASSESSSDTKPPKGQDELSACLAEAASALLSSASGSSRSSSGSTGRKKGIANIAKTQTTDDEKVDVKKLFTNKEINVRQHGHLVQLILTPSTPVAGIRNAITIQVMNELREALSILKDDDDCRVVLFTSTGTSFCEGLDLSHLLHSNKDERKLRAEEMAATVKDFISTLSKFNKPIVAGVQGAAIGLGVTMLPLFDLVIASDKATFSTPYGKLGQIAEGSAVLTLSHSLGSAVTNELLLGGRVLTASEALRAGLVTRVLWPDRFQVELLPSLKSMSEQSSQSMEATKALLRHSLRKKLDIANATSESLLLIQHWCSSECQEAIKTYLEEKGQ